MDPHKTTNIGIYNYAGSYAEEDLQQLDDWRKPQAEDYVSSGDKKIDDALGGGFPRKEITLLTGVAHSEKTLLAP